MCVTHACVVTLLLAGVATGDAQTPPPPPKTLEQTAPLARQLLADELKVPLATVTVAEQRERTWTDAQLGCAPRQGVFEPVPTPGYEFQVLHAGRRYQVRADRAGLVKRCEAAPTRRDGPAGKPKPRG